MATFNDGLVSMANSLGQRSNARKYVSSAKMSDNLIEALYSDNWIIQKYINKRADDMTRLDLEITSSLSSDEHTLYTSILTRWNIRQHRKEAAVWSSLYGDCIVLAITDQDDLSKPLDIDTENLKRFLTLDKTAYTLGDGVIEDSITSPNFGKPRTYDINGITVHNSRVCRIRLGLTPFRKRGSNFYGKTDLAAIYQPLISYLATVTNISDIVDLSKTDVLKITGFNASIAANQESLFIEAAEAMKRIRSSTDAMFIDADAEYDQKELTFAGLVDILKSFRDDLAGACDMPLTLLFGQSAAGFASGEEDTQNYHQTIASLQASRLYELDKFFNKFIADEMNLDKIIEFKYQPIEITNDIDVATVLSSTVPALSTALTDGVITEVEYATELKNKGLVSSITDETIANLTLMVTEYEENENLEAQQASRTLLSEPDAGTS